MTGRTGQTGLSLRDPAVAPSVVAALAALSLIVGIVVSLRGPDIAKADTVLRVARAAIVELADGSSRPAVVGTTVPRGATVRTAAGGTASLVAAGRTVVLGSETAVTVLDGKRERLRAGLVMVDAQKAPGLSLDAGPATVKASHGALVRVERGVLLRTAAYAGKSSVRATSRKAQVAVPGLHQVQVPDGGLPGRVTPLVLAKDAWDNRYAKNLVDVDDDLLKLAAGLDLNEPTTSAVLHVVATSYADAAPPDPGQRGSELALSYLLAKATHRGPDAYPTVREYRADGGSWGVVAALVGADVGKVSLALDSTLGPGAQPAAFAGGAPANVGPGAVLGGGPATGPATGSDPGSGSTPAGPSGQPAPAPSSDPVNDIVTTVTGLLPVPLPTLLPLPGGGSPVPLLPSAQLPGAQLPGVQLPGVQLPGVQLPGVQLPGVQLPGVQLPGVQLPGTTTTPLVPSLPSVPSLPPVPSLPSVPSLPPVPRTSPAPSLPALPGVPTVTTSTLPSLPKPPALPPVGTVTPAVTAAPLPKLTAPALPPAPVPVPLPVPLPTPTIGSGGVIPL